MQAIVNIYLLVQKKTCRLNNIAMVFMLYRSVTK